METTIAICTKLRPELKDCLDSLMSEINQDFHLFLIINLTESSEFNHSRVDATYYEEEPGLSRARNRAINECRTKYLCFVDDDSYVEPGFIDELQHMISENSFAAFGGRYIPWYKIGKPNWYSDKWASSRTLRGDSGDLPIGYFPGGVSCWDVEEVKRLGGFPEHLGMSGRKISYGEEVWMQKKLREASKTLGYNPDLMIRHLVAEEKLNSRWLWKSSYAKGRDSWEFQIQKRTPILFFKITSKAIFKLVFDFLNELFCFLSRKTLHLKTSFMHATIPFAYALGRLSAFFKKN